MYVERTYKVFDEELRWVMQNILTAGLMNIKTELIFGNEYATLLKLKGVHDKVSEYEKYLNSDAQGNFIKSVKRYFV